MKAFSTKAWRLITVGSMAALFAFATYAVSAATAEIKVNLSGDQEAPPVKTAGSGSGTIKIGDDKSVSGSVTTKNVPGTAAHIHQGAPGENGKVIIPLTKSGDEWKVPEGAKLTDEQYKAFQAGNLYVNVHTKANPNGEVRAQLKPAS